MIVAVAVYEIYIPHAQSLKDKRGVIRPLTSALRQRCNVSVAETAHQDLWQRAEIACAAIGSEPRVVEETLRAADRIVEAADGVRIIDTAKVFR